MAIMDYTAGISCQSRAHEVDCLIETGRKCGIVADPAFFREMVSAVYGTSAMNGFADVLGRMLEAKDKEEN